MLWSNHYSEKVYQTLAFELKYHDGTKSLTIVSVRANLTMGDFFAEVFNLGAKREYYETAKQVLTSVSYTHLTLPTIYSV